MNYKKQVKSKNISGYKVYEPNSDEIYIEKTWKESLIPFLFILVFFTIWYYGLLSTSEENNANILERIINIISDEPIIIIFFAAPLFIMVPILYKTGSKIISKEIIFIDRKRGTIMRNNRLLISFADIKELILDRNNLKLDIRMKNDKILKFIKFRNAVGLDKMSNKIAELIKIPISNN